MLSALVVALFVSSGISQKATCGHGDSNCSVVCRKNNTNLFDFEYINPLTATLNVEKVSARPKCDHSMSHYGPYKYQCERVKYPMSPGFICGLNSNNSDPNAYVCYPTDSSLINLPINSFIHGLNAGGSQEESDYKGLLETWASWGIVTVAPESCKQGGCNNLYYDQETAIMEAQQLGTSLHPIFGRVNFSKIAISGHSMGGFVTQETAGQWMNNYMYHNFSAKCAILLHPGLVCPGCQCNDMMTIPSMWTTGTSDDIVRDTYVLNCYNKEINKNVFPKVFADLTGATHFEPNDNDGGHLAPYMAQFMLCILNNDQTACNYVYGSGQTSLCQACEYKTCQVDKS